METFSALLGWLTFVVAMIAVVTAGCLVATVVQVASGAGWYGGRPLPGGVTRRAEEVEARLRARYRGRPPLLVLRPELPEAASQPEAVGEEVVPEPLAA